MIKNTTRRMCLHAGTCLFCSKVFNYNLYRHMRTHIGENPNLCQTDFRCKICNKYFFRLGSLKLHRLTHKDSHPIVTSRDKRTCPFCQKYHVNLTDLNSHLLQHIGERPFECSLCDFATTSKNVLQKHQAVHATKKLVECPSCKKTFADLVRLKSHQRRIHDRPTTKINCSLCPYTCYHKIDLKKHLISHTNEKHFKCDQCSKAFASAAGLKYHRPVHFPEEKKMLSRKCSECGITLSSARSLNTHVKNVHSDLKPYSCQICNKSFNTRNSLQYHMDIHTRGVLVKCRVCPVTLPTRAERHEHEFKYHAKDNPEMRCGTCRKTIRKFDFQDHMKRHNRNKKHSCIFCWKTFFKLGELAEHMRGHIREFPSWCHSCGHEFKRYRPNLIKKHKCLPQ